MARVDKFISGIRNRLYSSYLNLKDKLTTIRPKEEIAPEDRKITVRLENHNSEFEKVSKKTENTSQEDQTGKIANGFPTEINYVKPHEKDKSIPEEDNESDYW